ncbi:MAG: hypothetical protein VB081_04585 [Christensenella sp.]|uniref:hypothetical protein n=1 Tax=Christensenella sp. TaxID=1935934 RepID=UPI002B1FCB85|nr:hypothetical protein [Christensenella sp.]MEA5002755.1 hypothetical protein [Christensenella sp.]
MGYTKGLQGTPWHVETVHRKYGCCYLGADGTCEKSGKTGEPCFGKAYCSSYLGNTTKTEKTKKKSTQSKKNQKPEKTRDQKTTESYRARKKRGAQAGDNVVLMDVASAETFDIIVRTIDPPETHKAVVGKKVGDTIQVNSYRYRIEKIVFKAR